MDFKKYSILTTPKEISQFYKINLDSSGNSESASLKKWEDGAYDLLYEYESPDSDKYTPLSYSIEISKRNSEQEAIRKFDLIKSYIRKVNSSTSNQTVKEYDSIISSGDQNLYAIRDWKGIPNGIFFVYRKKHIVYSLVSSGYFKNDQTFIKKLIEPKLTTLNNFRLME